MNFADRDEWGFDELHEAVDILLAAHHREVGLVMGLKEEVKQLRKDKGELLGEVKKFQQIENGPVDVLGCWNWLANNYPDIAMEYQDGDGDNR